MQKKLREKPLAGPKQPLARKTLAAGAAAQYLVYRKKRGENMKICWEETGVPGAPELILRCERITPALQSLCGELERALDHAQPEAVSARSCRRAGETVLLRPEEIYYLESVEDKTFAYTAQGEYQLSLSLAAATERFAGAGIVRTGKAQAVNARHLASLQSRVGGGLNGTLDNGEHVLISRRYARALREVLKGEA
jgi:DNA-binding LytR/AlgR family response regulator